MRNVAASLFRITSRAAFLAFALILGLVLWYLPSLLNLDAYRPRVTSLLETTFHCKAIVGGITAQIIPSPGLVIAHVVLLENAKTPRLLASVAAVRLSVSARPLLKGVLAINEIRFLRPRFIAHRIREPSGTVRWVMLVLPKSPSSKDTLGIDQWQVRNGRIEIWDQTRIPTTQWVADQMSGSFLVRRQTGSLGGKALQLGGGTILNVHYDGAAAFPVQAHLNNMKLDALQFLVPERLLTLEGQTDLSLRARFNPATDIRAEIDQPSGAGRVEVTIQNQARAHWRWSVLGKHTRLNGATFEVPEWSAKQDDEGTAVYVRATSAEGAMAEVSWTKTRPRRTSAGPASEAATLEVDVSSVTIRQILQVFKLESKTPAAAGAAFNPYGYEFWRISRGSMSALIHGTTSFEIRESAVDVAGMNLDLTGTFDLSKDNSNAHIQGKCLNIPVTSVVESFFAPPSPITGTGAATFSLAFPLSRGWLNGLNGPVQVEVKDGVLTALKAIYRITSVLNLGNYLRLRLPKITAKGLEFENLSGHISFQNGVLSSEDLFAKSPNMNLGAKGSLDLPGHRVKAALRLEMLRFLEDILRDVPITHWIFKKPNKIFLPLVVTLEGPWNDVDVR